ncbi:hypothetical protein TcWFU_003678 [Taenia crassiceps]|uniref:Uncharacterized protein n=1 Tax=Taenia crassiceps TaxID=6207 RepID=A0ABR4QRV5_9CEST
MNSLIVALLDGAAFGFAHISPISVLLFGRNPFKPTQGRLYNPQWLSQLIPLHRQEMTFSEERTNSIIVPCALSNIWGVLNGQTVDGQGLQNETECCVVNPGEGVVVIEVMSLPRFLPFVIWRKHRDTEIFTKTKKSSDIPDKPDPPSLNDIDCFVDDEELTDSFVSRTLKFCEPGTFVVEVYGVAIGTHPVTMKSSRIMELIGQFLVHIIEKQEVCGIN